jgi:hypothetical protein
MLSVGLIPDRHYLNPGIGGQHARCKLRLGLMRKSVAHTHRKFWKPQLFTHYDTLHTLLV